MEENVDKLVLAVQELSLARNIERVMEIVRSAARELTGADGATFILRDHDLCYYADEDALSPLWKGQRFPMEMCVSGWVMLNKQQALIPDIYKDERVPIDAYKTTFVKSIAMVPIRTIEPIGAIGNYWAKEHLPTVSDLKLLQSLADITAVTLENIKVYEELERRVEERTEQLMIANKELEAFSYTISHDLHAPLRNVSNYMGVLLDDMGDKFDEEGKRIASRLIDNVENMQQLIDDLLDFFKMGHHELVLSFVDMNKLVSEICQDIKDQKVNGRVKLVQHELPSVVGENTLLKQVWINLMSNAIKYSSKVENPVIEIGYEEHPEEFVYYVKDNGIGFNMKYYHKLFGIFQRLHNSKDFEGSGIGLATVQKILIRHKGKIWATSVPDEGTTFYFSLPHKQGISIL